MVVMVCEQFSAGYCGWHTGELFSGSVEVLTAVSYE